MNSEKIKDLMVKSQVSKLDLIGFKGFDEVQKNPKIFFHKFDLELDQTDGKVDQTDGKVDITDGETDITDGEADGETDSETENDTENETED